MKVNIYSFNGENFSSEKVISVTMMTMMGEITILDRHTPLLSAFKPSTLFLLYKDENGVDYRNDFAVGSGFVEVKDSEVKILTDMLIDVEDQKDIDKNAVELAKADALALMEKYKQGKDRIDMEKFIEAEDNLMKSIAQLKLYETRK
ncbi:hypothetical protein EOM39_02195 [Candidatus Gracilibacteria bacterium]|nr:hypothetical protein [Candidatus Gracilibacteria bacterium]